MEVVVRRFDCSELQGNKTNDTAKRRAMYIRKDNYGAEFVSKM